MDMPSVPTPQKRQISHKTASVLIIISLIVLGVSLIWTSSKVRLAVTLNSSDASELAAITCPALVSGITVGSSDAAPNGPIYQLQTYLASARVQASLVLPDYHIKPSGVFDDPTRMTLEVLLRAVWKTGALHEITPDIVQLIMESCKNIKTQ